MGQINIPTDNKIKGPWLLDSKGLEELHETLTTIESKLEEAFTAIVDKTAEAKLEEYRKWDNEMDIEKAKLKVKDSYPFEKNDKYVLIITKQGKKIKDDNLLSLLKSSQVNDFNPTELRIQIEKGPCEFILEISTKYDGELETRIKTLDDSIFNDISYEINKWTEKHKPNVLMQKWSNWFPWAAFPISMILLFSTPLLFKSKSDIYKNQLTIESSELLNGGLSTVQEQNRALEILLQNQSGYLPADFNPNMETNNTLANILLFVFIALAILLIKPRTVIGLGQNKWKINFYRKWSYIVLVYIPVSIILPVIKSKIF